MEVWGLTGPIGSGKSLALDFFAKVQTVFVIDADKVAKEIYEPHFKKFSQFCKDLVKIFGPEVLSKPKGLPQKDFIRSEVSQNPELRVKLEKLIHPLIRNAIEEKISTAHKNSKLVIIEGTRLVESDWAKTLLKGMICVDAPEDMRRQRVRQRNPKEFNQIWALGRSQDPQKMKDASQFVWVNDGNKLQLGQNVNQFLKDRGIPE
jgi:dephospho-CoA kinase